MRRRFLVVIVMGNGQVTDGTGGITKTDRIELRLLQGRDDASK